MYLMKFIHILLYHKYKKLRHNRGKGRNKILITEDAEYTELRGEDY
jgi:hypothetical protein